MLKECRHHINCVFKDNQCNCHILSETTFINHSCPFAKTKDELLNELKFCAESNNFEWEEYKKMLKEVYDINVYKRVFEGDTE